MEKIKKSDGFEGQYLFVLPETFLASVSENVLFNAITVTDIGYFPRARYHRRRREEGCPAAILLYCCDGEGFCTIGSGPARPLSSGQVLLLGPNTPHEYGASEHDPWSVYWLHLEGSFYTGYSEMMQTQPICITPQKGRQIEEQFQQCFRMLNTPLCVERYYLLCQRAGLILGLLAGAYRQTDIQLTSKGGRGIDNAIQCMESHLRRSLSLSTLAREAGFSHSHINHLFKESTGYAPIEYFLRMKIHAASRELYFSQRPVKDIALSYGIDDPYYFSRLFKQIMGMSPTEYRNQLKG